jgi:methylaspartate mutase epsilon subunit
VIQLLEMLLSLEEGVKSFSVSFSQTGSISQDIVSTNVIKKLAPNYAEKIGCGDAKIHLVYHQWMGAFPRDKEFSDSLINTSTVIAAMVRADKMITKTRDESIGIPTPQVNAAAVRNSQYTLNMLRGFPTFSDPEEEENLTQMVDDIMEAVMNDPADTLWRQIFNSIKNGIIDIPFSPHIINNGEAITVRDKNYNIRIYERGNLPISDKCLAFERSKVDLCGKSLVEHIIDDIGIML